MFASHDNCFERGSKYLHNRRLLVLNALVGSLLIEASAWGQDTNHITIVTSAFSDGPGLLEQGFNEAQFDAMRRLRIEGSDIWYVEVPSSEQNALVERLRNSGGSVFGEPNQLFHDLAPLSDDQTAQIERSLDELTASLAGVADTGSIQTVRMMNPAVQFGFLASLETDTALTLQLSDFSTSVSLPEVNNETVVGTSRWTFGNENASVSLWQLDSGTHGVIRAEGRAFIIRPLLFDVHALIEVSTGAEPEEEYPEEDRVYDEIEIEIDPLGDNELDTREDCEPGQYSAPAPFLVSLWIHYTSDGLAAMRNLFGGSESDFVEFALSEANETYRLNCLPIVLEATLATSPVTDYLLVRDQEASCSTSSSGAEIVVCARRSMDTLKDESTQAVRGFLTGVRSSRFDLAVIVTGKMDSRGRAPSIGPQKDYTVLLVRPDAVLAMHTLLHELGHFQGGDHDLAFVDPVGKSTSIVAREQSCCNRERYFSSSRLDRGSGVVGAWPGQDNHFRMFRTAEIVSKIR